MNYFPFHIGDYRAATAHLSNEEDLAYRRLLDMYYDSEQPIPLETQWVARRLRLDTQHIEIVLSDFFTKQEDGWHHARCDAEIAEYVRNAEKNRANGKKGGRPKATPALTENPVGSQMVSAGMPVATQVEGNQEPRTSNQEPIVLLSPAKLPTCPANEIVNLYHAVLPSLPSVRLMNDKRKKSISKFWQFVLTSKKSDGTARATNSDEATAWIKAYFERANENDFLMGRGQRSDAHSNWECDIDFLMSDKGMKQVIEKTRDAA